MWPAASAEAACSPVGPFSRQAQSSTASKSRRDSDDRLSPSPALDRSILAQDSWNGVPFNPCVEWYRALHGADPRRNECNSDFLWDCVPQMVAQLRKVLKIVFFKSKTKCRADRRLPRQDFVVFLVQTQPAPTLQHSQGLRVAQCSQYQDRIKSRRDVW